MKCQEDTGTQCNHHFDPIQERTPTINSNFSLFFESVFESKRYLIFNSSVDGKTVKQNIQMGWQKQNEE